jgi:hypothetical protein
MRRSFAGCEQTRPFFFQSGGEVFHRAVHRLRPRYLRHESSVVDRLRHGMSESIYPLAFGRDHADDRNPETAREQGRVDGDPGPVRRIGHIERDDHGQAEVGHLRGEEKIAHHIGCIDHADYGVRFFFAVEVARQEIERHAFIGRRCRKAVSAGEIDKGEDAPATFPGSGFFFDRDTRVVPDFLAGTGQAVEKGRFARVRIADQSDANPAGFVFAHAHTTLSTKP